jgi:transketolase
MGEQITYSVSEAIEESTTGIPLLYYNKEAFNVVLESQNSVIQKTKIFAQLARLNALYMVAKAGSGHLGSSFSSLDIVSWLYLNVLKAEDRYYSSKGHDSPGLYAVQSALGIIPFDKIHGLRRIDGLPGHPDISTPGAHTNTGSLGMGVSKAKGFLFADDLLGKKKGRVFVLTGDGELQEGQFWESLVSAAKRNDGRLTVIVDHNKVQSDTYVENVSDLGDLEAKFQAFGWDVHRCNGHDYEKLESLLGTPGREGKAKVIIADTIKGCGVSFMEHTSMEPNQEYYGYHSGALNRDDYKRASNELIENINTLLGPDKCKLLKLSEVNVEPLRLPENNERMIPVYSETILNEAKINHNLVVLDADLVLDTGLIEFKKKYPERFIECGIAEQDMVSQAGTMAIAGLLPVVHSFACFLTSRASEQIYNNCTEKKKIIYVGSLAGLLPSGPGHSHQAVRDVIAMSAMPGIKIIEPVNSKQVKAALEWAVRTNTSSSYLRLTSIPYENINIKNISSDLIEGRGEIVSGDRGDVVLVTAGPIMTEMTMSIALKLKGKGYSVQVICTSWLNCIDIDWYKEQLKDSKVILTIENSYVERGFGTWFISQLAIASIEVATRSEIIGLNEVPACGTANEVLKYHGLDEDSILTKILSHCDKCNV